MDNGTAEVESGIEPLKVRRGQVVSETASNMPPAKSMEKKVKKNKKTKVVNKLDADLKAAAKVKKVEPAQEAAPVKRKPGRPKKSEVQAAAAPVAGKKRGRKPGRPKKSTTAVVSAAATGKKRGRKPGRPAGTKNTAKRAYTKHTKLVASALPPGSFPNNLPDVASLPISYVVAVVQHFNLVKKQLDL